jgi:hypothetical protein
MPCVRLKTHRADGFGPQADLAVTLLRGEKGSCTS